MTQQVSHADLAGNIRVEKLKAGGITFESYGGEMQTDENGIMWGKRHNNGPNIAWFKDPAGNFLSVVEA